MMGQRDNEIVSKTMSFYLTFIICSLLQLFPSRIRKGTTSNTLGMLSTSLEKLLASQGKDTELSELARCRKADSCKSLSEHPPLVPFVDAIQ
jgi:hypothetical protein